MDVLWRCEIALDLGEFDEVGQAFSAGKATESGEDEPKILCGDGH